MTTLGLAMIVRNEEQVIGRVLADAASFCDELVVVDTGSTDATVEIARQAGARVEHFTWVDDFAAARNASFAACTTDWILWLDADDRVPPEVQTRLEELKPTLDVNLDAVYLTYKYTFSDDGTTCTCDFPRERLLRRAAEPRWEGAVHEVISVDGERTSWRNDLWIEHRPPPSAAARKQGRNLAILERVVAGGDRSLRTLFYYGNELWANGRAREALVAWLDFARDAPRGWEKYAALTSMATCQLQLGHPEDAELTLHRALREDPTRAEAYLQLGLLHYNEERWSAAVPYFLAASGCKPPREGFIAVLDYAYRPWDYLSVCYQRMGDQPKALEALAKALPGNPDRERLIDNAGWILRGW